jgi:8-oxo-dGTP pyrophosphatase MutT (NUDIX family)
MQNNPPSSLPISNFFVKVFGEEPTISVLKKETHYSIPDNSIHITSDCYGGCHVNVTSFSHERAELIKETIQELSKIFQETKAFNSIWLNFPLPCSLSTVGMVAPSSCVIGMTGKCDLIYDRQANKLRVWSWLNQDKVCTIPSGATHSVGGAALIIDKIAMKILLVVNNDRNHSWNLPGGSFDPLCDQSPSSAALREAQEEGGFQIEEIDLQPRLIGQMQFPKNQFASAISQIWAFFLDNVSLKKLNPPQEEIARAEWISFDEVLQSNGTLKGLNLGLEIKEGLKAALEGRGFQEILKNDWMTVHI